MRILANEKLMEWPMPLISVGNNSAVIVQGIVRRPSILEHTNIRRHTTGTQPGPVTPSLFHIVTAPEMNIQTVMQNKDSITRNLRLKRFRSQAFSNDITNRTTPRNIDATNGSMPSAPIS
jgi:hypothetical protein